MKRNLFQELCDGIRELGMKRNDQVFCDVCQKPYEVTLLESVRMKSRKCPDCRIAIAGALRGVEEAGEGGLVSEDRLNGSSGL
jgi:hypothetical protein